MNQKKELREQMILRRKLLSPSYMAESSQRISKNLTQASFYIHADMILFYMAFRNEVNVGLAMEEAWKTGKKVVLPRVNPKERTMSCYQVESFAELKPGSYGILEPPADPEKEVHPAELSLVVVPGVAFDHQGYRLGYGGGYYDRFFSQYPSCLRVGVAYPEQIVETVYPESHDQPLNYLVTSQGIFNF
ncbi:5-formyltetrahydrofolate cyclo-ligase [Thermoflavimicrobium dichotomicum]|uniref:5-formyltetrahydrofolate cyclo-ligase n=1 Tax=Thermoflavimicrobium dichotomicum TaxID=46223 RepID=A0A1I3TQZ8_9BACL|nr:5-formyltetrahydrofolate cyclo-ligase [Thermoflavimicrobium dichotomicum]SFJ72903.1 5-formyltetrahydrofolate cyclo-ligase [Thermoflavimicrobium dichotomicum]